MSFLSLQVMLKHVRRSARPRPAARQTPRARLSTEALEDRSVPAQVSAGNMVYVLNNDFDPGENAVLAYRQADNGALTLEGTYATGGTGLANRDEILGTDDNDLPLIASPDGRFLFAVNGGSDDVSVFRVNPSTGGLTLFGRTPSGGDEPVSVGLTPNNVLVVVNQGGDDLGRRTPGAAPASYTTLKFTTDGVLTPTGSKIMVDNGAAPTVAYVAPNGFVYSAEMFDDAGTNQTNPLLTNSATRTGIRVLKVDAAGALSQVEFEASPQPNIWLGLKANPSGTVLYVGFAASSQVGAFSINPNGSLDFRSAVSVQTTPNGQPTATCWLEVSPLGDRLYAINNFDNSVSTFSLVNPLQPALLQQLFLANPGPAPDYSSASADGVVPGGLQGFVSSDPHEVALSPDGKYLYVVGTENRIDNGRLADGSRFKGNQLHVLNVAANGLLTQKQKPTVLPGSFEGYHPQGVVALRARGTKTDGAVGAVFVATNHNGTLAPDGPGNEVLMYAQAADGSLSIVDWFATGGEGSGPSVRFAGDGLGSAHSVQLSEDGKFLFVTNAGSDTVSVFRVASDKLTLVDVEPTGDFPNSVTQHGDVVYVLNASGDASVTGFRLSSDGDLTPLSRSTRTLNANQDPDRPDTLFNPTQVSFTPDGKQLVVTIKDGPAAGAIPGVTPTGKGRVLVFSVGSDGRPSANFVQTNLGNQGPFGFSFDESGNLITSLFVGGPNLTGAAGSFRINANGTLTAISRNVPNTQLDSCWIENNGEFAFAANYTSGTISSYKIGPNGSLTLLRAVAGRTNDLPGDGVGKPQGSTPLDIRVSPDGKFLYDVLPGSGAVAGWRINPDGSLTKVGEFAGLPDTVAGDVGMYNGVPTEFGPGGSPAGIAIASFRNAKSLATTGSNNGKSLATTGSNSGNGNGNGGNGGNGGKGGDALGARAVSSTVAVAGGSARLAQADLNRSGAADVVSVTSNGFMFDSGDADAAPLRQVRSKLAR